MFYAGDKISGIEGPLNGNMYYFYNGVGEPIRRKSVFPGVQEEKWLRVP